MTTFERGAYVQDDGTTAINEGGGIVEGPSAGEVRLAPGSLASLTYAVMKLHVLPNFIIAEALNAGLPRLHIAGGVTIESPSINFFRGEWTWRSRCPSTRPRALSSRCCGS